MVKIRQSNIELLRILAMLMIVAGHLFCQSSLARVHPSFGMTFAASGARLACNLFLIVGCWFLVDAEFSWKRVGRLYFTVLTYTVPLTILTLALGGHPAMKDVIRGFLPFTGRALWFASAWISLLVLSIWLRRAFELSRRSLGGLVLTLTMLLSLVCTLPDEQKCYAIDCVWFVYVYLAVGFLKKHIVLPKAKLFSISCLIGGVTIYVALAAARFFSHGSLSSWAAQCLADFKTLPNFVAALLIFIFFLKLDIRPVRWINALAKSAFAVYIIHQTPAFFPFLWSKICRVDVWARSPNWILWSVVVVLGVYGSGCILEFFRNGACHLVQVFALARKK